MANEKAILAGGCFWGVEELIRNLPGVSSTVVGYTGGDVKNATYRNHGTHAEASLSISIRKSCPIANYWNSSSRFTIPLQEQAGK
jgi:peptide methionine sulfoxide reductase MsrA